MRIKLRLALVAAAAAAAIPAVAAPAAMAQTGVDCQYTGQATTSGVGVLSNTGTFSFTSLTFTCEGAADGGTYSGAATLSVPASGTFNNIACGTGSATGSGSVTATPVAGNLAAGFNGGSVSFSITFVGGEGVLTGSGSGAAGTVSIDGTTSIVPTGGGSTPNTTDCTDNFEVAGDAALTAA